MFELPSESNQYVSVTKFNGLCDDVLWDIFDYFTIGGKIGVQRVCRRFRRVIDEIIECDELRFEDTFPESSPFHIKQLQNDSILSNLTLANFKRVEKLLIHDRDSSDPPVVELSTLKMLIDFFPELTSLSLIKIKVNCQDENWAEIGNVAANLQQICFRYVLAKPEFFIELLRPVSKLKQFELYGCGFDFQSQLLPKLNHNHFSKLEKIRVDTKNALNFAVVCKAMNNLEEVKIEADDKERVNFAEVAQVLQQCPSLRALTMGFAFSFGDVKIEPGRSNFGNLKSLSLGYVETLPSLFGRLLKQIPCLRKLRLSPFNLICECSREIFGYIGRPVKNSTGSCHNPNLWFCLKCKQEFANALSTIPFLEVLEIDSADELAALCSELEYKFKNEVGFPMLRKLTTYTHHSFITPRLYDAFCERATRQPNKMFHFEIIDQDNRHRGSWLTHQVPKNVTLRWLQWSIRG